MTVLVDTFWTAFPVHTPLGGNSACTERAVLELARPLVFNKYVQPVCLPLAIQKFPVGRKCVISGWGNTQEGNGELPIPPGLGL